MVPYSRWLRLLTMLLPSRIYIARGPWHLGDFWKLFESNIGEDQKKVSPSERGGPSSGNAPYYGKSGASNCFTFIKMLNERLK